MRNTTLISLLITSVLLTASPVLAASTLDTINADLSLEGERGYTNGAFAANFSKQDSNYAESRVGVEFSYQAKDNLDLIFRPAWGHSLSGDNGSFTADVGGLSQSLASDTGDKNWGEVTIGAKYQATDKVRFTTVLTGRSGDTGEPAGTIMIGTSVRF